MIVCVTIHGDEEVTFSPEDSKEMETDPDFVQNKMDKSGGLSQAVRLAILKEGYEISFVGCGISGWDLGLILEEDKADIFKQFISSKFSKALERELIFINSWVPGETESEEEEGFLEEFDSDED